MRDLPLCTPVMGTKRIKWGQPHGGPWVLYSSYNMSFFISSWFLLILSNLSSILSSHLMIISLNSCSDRLLASNLFTSFSGDACFSFICGLFLCLPMVSLFRMSGYAVLSLLRPKLFRLLQVQLPRGEVRTESWRPHSRLTSSSRNPPLPEFLRPSHHMAGLGVLCHHPSGPMQDSDALCEGGSLSTFHTPGNGPWRLRPQSQSRAGIQLRALLLKPGASSSSGARTLSSVAHQSFISRSSKQVLRAQVTRLFSVKAC
uniref:Uncharacterized protein n=1 Tax=Pipistrellus kuhlii TaxID=59472 RepID=A0A7J8A7E1_PIPKU|nr:hypothetical protein mPipKuh1_008805 [Pipistrellus kuhlii]